MTVSGVRSEKLLLLAVVVAILMDSMDGSIVNIALPSIASDLGTDTASASWIVVSYLMVLAGLILLFGRIADRGALRKVFVFGFGIFTAASLFCGISDSFAMLLVSRILQGFGGAMLAAAAPMICVKYMPREKLGLSLAVVTLGSSLGYALGPPLGGMLTQMLSWHWIFLINVPIGLIAIPLALHAIPKDGESSKEHVDLFGGMLLFAAIVTGILALEKAGNPEESVFVPIAAVACLGLLSLFIFRELECRAPIIDVRIFGSGNFNSVFLAYLIFNIAYAGTFYLLPFYMSLVLGFTPGMSGMYLLIPSVVTGLTCLVFGRLSDRRGRRMFAVGACLSVALYNAIMWFMMPENGHWLLIPITLLMGLSWGFAGGPMAGRVVEHAPEGHAGIGSSVMALSTYLGAGIGIALFAAVFSFSSGAPGKEFVLLEISEFASGFSVVVVLGVLLALVGALLSFIVKDTVRSQ
ncbi:MAG: DHA2 family efflux MFS transporter permease subunit [Candidatus Methanomethylophilaceae archaeon]